MLLNMIMEMRIMNIIMALIVWVIPVSLCLILYNLPARLNKVYNVIAMGFGLS